MTKTSSRTQHWGLEIVHVKLSYRIVSYRIHDIWRCVLATVVLAVVLMLHYATELRVSVYRLYAVSLCIAAANDAS